MKYYPATNEHTFNGDYQDVLVNNQAEYVPTLSAKRKGEKFFALA